MGSQRGSALILALLMLMFLMILGSVLLTSVTLDVAIGENYRSETQLLYVAEAGIEDARRLLRYSSGTPSQLLTAAAGADGVISPSRDLDSLLNQSDDIPILNGGSRSAGKLLVDTSGKPAGHYYVFLRNDSADGLTSPTDSNEVLSILSVAVIGDSRKVIEETVMRWRFPKLPASLVLDGSPAIFTPPGSTSEISGMDLSGMGGNYDALGVLTDADRIVLLGMMSADIGVIDGVLDPRLRTIAGLERIVDSALAIATDIANPGWNGSALLANTGSSDDYRLVVVNGDCELGTGVGYGILLVRGNLRMSGNFRWNGLILVIGQGTLAWPGGGSGVISGNVFVARTRAADRSAVNELGTLLADRGAVEVNFSGDGNNSIQIENPGAPGMNAIYRKFPYVPISIREY